MDRFAALNCFARVVELGGFAKAAERLALSTSSVSRLIAELETLLGTRLINRTTRRLSLTESGRVFHERCVQILADLEAAEALAGESAARPVGTLRLTCSINFGLRHLAPAIAEFAARHPGLRFDVSLSDRFVDLVEEGYDLAIRIGEDVADNLAARRLGETRLVLCAAPSYLERHGTPETPRDLLQHVCLTYEYLPVRDTWRFRDTRGREQTVRVSGRVHANNGDLLVAAAVHGVGIVLEPDFIVGPELQAGRLVSLLPAYTAPGATIYAVYPSHRHLPAKVRAFIDFLAERLRDGGTTSAPAG